MTLSTPIAPLSSTLSSPPRRKRLPLKWPLILALTATALWFGYTRFIRSSGGASEAIFAVATRGDLVIAVTEQGELQSRDAEPVINELGGREGSKLVDILPEGTKVRKGDEVARFDNDAILKLVADQELKVETADSKVKTAASALEVAKNKADGEIAKAELELTLAKLDYESYEVGEYSALLDKTNAALEMAKKQLLLEEDSYKFTRDMVKKGFAPTEQLLQLERGVQSQKFTVQEREADLRVLTKYSKVRKLTELKAKAEEAKRILERAKNSNEAEINKAKTELASSTRALSLEQQELERDKKQLDRCIVRAPTDGIVVYYAGNRYDPESKIRAGAILHRQQPIFTLPDLTKLQVKVKVHESVVKKVKKGQSATMAASSLPNITLRGTVLNVATFASGDDWRGGAVKEYLSEVSIDNLPADAGLKPGMTAEVKIAIQTLHDVITIPVNGVTEINGQHVCYVLTGSGIERRVVTVGEGNEQVIQVATGLAEGEKVALDARTRGLAETKVQSPGSAAPKPAASPVPGSDATASAGK